MIAQFILAISFITGVSSQSDYNFELRRVTLTGSEDTKCTDLKHISVLNQHMNFYCTGEIDSKDLSKNRINVFITDFHSVMAMPSQKPVDLPWEILINETQYRGFIQPTGQISQVAHNFFNFSANGMLDVLLEFVQMTTVLSPNAEPTIWRKEPPETASTFPVNPNNVIIEKTSGAAAVNFFAPILAAEEPYNFELMSIQIKSDRRGNDMNCTSLVSISVNEKSLQFYCSGYAYIPDANNLTVWITDPNPLLPMNNNTNITVTVAAFNRIVPCPVQPTGILSQIQQNIFNDTDLGDYDIYVNFLVTPNSNAGRGICVTDGGSPSGYNFQLVYIVFETLDNVAKLVLEDLQVFGQTLDFYSVNDTVTWIAYITDFNPILPMPSLNPKYLPWSITINSTIYQSFIQPADDGHLGQLVQSQPYQTNISNINMTLYFIQMPTDITCSIETTTDLQTTTEATTMAPTTPIIETTTDLQTTTEATTMAPTTPIIETTTNLPTTAESTTMVPTTSIMDETTTISSNSTSITQMFYNFELMHLQFKSQDKTIYMTCANLTNITVNGQSLNFYCTEPTFTLYSVNLTVWIIDSNSLILVDANTAIILDVITTTRVRSYEIYTTAVYSQVQENFFNNSGSSFPDIYVDFLLAPTSQITRVNCTKCGGSPSGYNFQLISVVINTLGFQESFQLEEIRIFGQSLSFELINRQQFVWVAYIIDLNSILPMVSLDPKNLPWSIKINSTIYQDVIYPTDDDHLGQVVSSSPYHDNTLNMRYFLEFIQMSTDYSYPSEVTTSLGTTSGSTMEIVTTVTSEDTSTMSSISTFTTQGSATFSTTVVSPISSVTDGSTTIYTSAMPTEGSTVPGSTTGVTSTLGETTTQQHITIPCIIPTLPITNVAPQTTTTTTTTTIPTIPLATVTTKNPLITTVNTNLLTTSTAGTTTSPSCAPCPIPIGDNTPETVTRIYYEKETVPDEQANTALLAVAITEGALLTAAAAGFIGSKILDRRRRSKDNGSRGPTTEERRPAPRPPAPRSPSSPPSSPPHISIPIEEDSGSDDDKRKKEVDRPQKREAPPPPIKLDYDSFINHELWRQVDSKEAGIQAEQNIKHQATFTDLPELLLTEAAVQAGQEVTEQGTLTDSVELPLTEAAVQVGQEVTEKSTWTDPIEVLLTEAAVQVGQEVKEQGTLTDPPERLKEAAVQVEQGTLTDTPELSLTEAAVQAGQEVTEQGTLTDPVELPLAEAAVQVGQEVIEKGTLTDPVEVPLTEAAVQVGQEVTEKGTLTDPPTLSKTAVISDGYWEEVVIVKKHKKAKSFAYDRSEYLEEQKQSERVFFGGISPLNWSHDSKSRRTALYSSANMSATRMGEDMGRPRLPKSSSKTTTDEAGRILQRSLSSPLSLSSQYEGYSIRSSDEDLPESSNSSVVTVNRYDALARQDSSASSYMDTQRTSPDTHE